MSRWNVETKLDFIMRDENLLENYKDFIVFTNKWGPFDREIMAIHQFDKFFFLLSIALDVILGSHVLRICKQCKCYTGSRDEKTTVVHTPNTNMVYNSDTLSGYTLRVYP